MLIHNENSPNSSDIRNQYKMPPIQLYTYYVV